ncbi:precorrin-6y C5,15-methyltransferase (decarboxylating) subunit CbiE [Aestuariirhabdus haliotis]|uniref:precorrin-6y C5,15-methyltransferase (decarboxylating) subunit CbiE n=1 Tax=Aestuariirhabdus haliotis TaxID=2918751 RepID=UPI0020BF9320|nr:precorrin-6y C5,15-methyltransferase (decarboxylating) subunit CbiE [Aestuariirhabdus haliotis]MCL6420618.1 precorrin-6y C5,15-methyltransferase (decarboxylating) subunit CbiE [Aestuariirhabdus haliotis]
MTVSRTIDWTGPPLTVIGIGAEASTQMTPEAEHALHNAELVIGSQRHLDSAGPLSPNTQTLHYPSPLSELHNVLDQHKQQSVVLLASGDPLLFGIGGFLSRILNSRQLRFIPALSSIQLAFARLGISWQTASVVSLHGRPLQRLRSALANRRTLALLTDHQSQPQDIARELHAANLRQSTLWVCEALGSEQERVRQFSIPELLDKNLNTSFHPLHVTLVKTLGMGNVQPEFPGIDDRQFATGEAPGQGMISKREVRLSALSLLQPCAQDIGWDVGAGCGALAVEWARWNPLGQVYAIEKHPIRAEFIEQNRDQFGVDANLRVVQGPAPNALHSLPNPDAVFIGGSDGQLDHLLHYCWQQLQPGGRLVASAVTEQSRATLLAFSTTDAMNGIDCHWTQIQVSRGDTLGNQLLLRPKAQVLLLQVRKPFYGTEGTGHD